MIENRQSQPTHIRDLLLLAATAALDEQFRPGSIDPRILADVDVVDVLAVAGRLVHGQVRALTVNLRTPSDREHAVAGVFQTAVAASGVAAAVSAVSAVVGATDDGEIAVAGVIARCLRAFDDVELLEAAVALIGSGLVALAAATDAGVTDVVRWSVGEETDAHSARPRRRMLCGRQQVDLVERSRARRP